MKQFCNLTFVLVALRLDAKDGHDHDDDDDGGGRQGDQEPGLAVERLRLQVAVLQVTFRGCLNLEEKGINRFKTLKGRIPAIRSHP